MLVLLLNTLANVKKLNIVEALKIEGLNPVVKA